jgi:hypothetical protein
VNSGCSQEYGEIGDIDFEIWSFVVDEVEQGIGCGWVRLAEEYCEHIDANAIVQ